MLENGHDHPTNDYNPVYLPNQFCNISWSLSLIASTPASTLPLHSLQLLFNPFPDVARYVQHETFILWCCFLQWPLEIGSASAERAGWGRWVGAPNGCRQHGRLWAPLWKRLGWLWVGHCCPPMHD